MIVLSLTLRAKANRWVNLIVGVVYGVVLATTVVSGEISENTAYYLLIAAAEAAVLALILWRAWRWPAEERRAMPGRAVIENDDEVRGVKELLD
jgi:high-affinity Fe2+/Pb2+ permease